MPERFDPRVEEALARYKLDLNRLKDAFGLLGVSPCSWCKKFFRRSDPGALFDAGELVCYGCIHHWWNHRCTKLNTKDRENLEGKLVFWLRSNHHAELFKDQAKLPESVDGPATLPLLRGPRYGVGYRFPKAGLEYLPVAYALWVGGGRTRQRWYFTVSLVGWSGDGCV